MYLANCKYRQPLLAKQRKFRTVHQITVNLKRLSSKIISSNINNLYQMICTKFELKGKSETKLYNELGLKSLRFRRWFRRLKMANGKPEELHNLIKFNSILSNSIAEVKDNISNFSDQTLIKILLFGDRIYTQVHNTRIITDTESRLSLNYIYRESVKHLSIYDLNDLDIFMIIYF